jgi:hypothetical protein
MQKIRSIKMNDRELLELAAKAAGIPFSNIELVWNPLTDDGDALRLAVKLDLFDAATLTYEPEEYRADPYAATRRAIVRAAAEIGKGM